MSKSEKILKEIVKKDKVKDTLTEILVREEMLIGDDDVFAYTSVNALASALGFSESYLNGVIMDNYYSDKY